MSIAVLAEAATRRRLDDEDFQEEIRAHLAIAADERMADGADREDRAAMRRSRSSATSR